MAAKGYDATFTSRYRMMTRFHAERIPLVILLAGTPCMGKSNVAAQLAARLNLPTCIQTKSVYGVCTNVYR
jgi:2-phosphoglycerate kinase